MVSRFFRTQDPVSISLLVQIRRLGRAQRLCHFDSAISFNKLHLHCWRERTCFIHNLPQSLGHSSFPSQSLLKIGALIRARSRGLRIDWSFFFCICFVVVGNFSTVFPFQNCSWKALLCQLNFPEAKVEVQHCLPGDSLCRVLEQTLLLDGALYPLTLSQVIKEPFYLSH